MNHDQLYEDWKQRRRQGDAPAGFTDRVMAAIEAGKRQSRVTAMVLALLSSRLGKVGVCALAAATCFFRLLHVIAIFHAQ